MVRGCQKRIYYIKDPRSALFTEAYFVLKNDGKTLSGKRELAGVVGEQELASVVGERELAMEAARLVDDMERRDRLPCYAQRIPMGQRIGAFVIGAATSSAIIGGIALLLTFA